LQSNKFEQTFTSCEKTSKSAQDTLQLNQNRNLPKRPFELPQEKTSSPSENGGDSKKDKIPINHLKIQVI
jgi:hypothetical protein